MRAGWVTVGAFVALMLAARPVAAQCMGGMTGGSHDHAAATSGDKKTRQAIERVLADERSREMLLTALVADAEFMRELIPRIVTMPEWRALTAQHLARSDESRAPVRPDSLSAAPPSGSPAAPAMVYRCPMHRDVTSSRPGNCPKCGMALRRET